MNFQITTQITWPSTWTQYHLCTRTIPVRRQFNQNREGGEIKRKGLLTAKGSKALVGGRRLHVLAAVAWGKGIILSEVYDKMNRDFFAQFIKSNFNLCFGKAGPKTDGKRLFVMNNDPCQTSKKAMLALTQIECELYRIPPRSPDINPIENVFHLEKKKCCKRKQ